ncbi:MAG TPA: hypothetical protein EYO07_05940 [Candidatus Marinimicrobia bacterium]|nr:hypothetical protein [Candidatus Neomarinimicrobiota bacterium]
MVPLDTNRAVFLTALLMLASVRVQECYPPGNVNYDGLVDIFDIVLTVDCIVGSECGDCSDANGDGITDVSDIILQTELFLVPPSCLYPTLTQIPVGNPLTIPSGEPYVGGDPDVIYDDDSGLYKVWHTAFLRMKNNPSSRYFFMIQSEFL